MTEETSLRDLLREIKEGKKRAPAQRLALLSGLYDDSLALFRRAWEGMIAAQRRDLMARLAELAEDNPELVFDPLFLIGLDDPDKQVRLDAIEGLADGQEPEAIRPLLRLLAQDSEEEVRAAAAQALSAFALMAELGELRPGPARELTQALLATARNVQETAEVRRRALEAVAAVNSDEIRFLIRQAYYEGEDKEKASALYAMGRNLDPEWAPLLLEELESSSPEFRYEASAALGEMGLEEAVEPLIHALEDDDIQVRLSAIHALSQIGGDQAKDALEGVLHSDDERLREAAQEALSEMALDQEPWQFLPNSRKPSPENGD